MRVDGIGELVEGDGYWRLIYDACGHSQEFAHEGLDDVGLAALYVRSHFEQCLTCAIEKRSHANVTATSNVDPAEFHVMLTRSELNLLVEALRQHGAVPLADRLEVVLHQTGP